MHWQHCYKKETKHYELHRAILQLMFTMASSSAAIHFFLLLVTLFSACYSSSVSRDPNSKPRPFILPIKKDPATKMFYTTVGIGTPQSNMDLVIHLAGENLWQYCNTLQNKSSYHFVDCESEKCPRGAVCSAGGCNGPLKPECSISFCDITITNPLARSTFFGTLVEDVIFISQTQVHGLLAACIDDFTGSNVLLGLPKSSKGIIGLSRSQLAFPTQLTLVNKLPPKFSICLPSSTDRGFGNIFIGAGGYPQVDSKFLQTTPLVVNPVATAPGSAVFAQGVPSSEYFIDVKSIQIDGQVVDIRPSLLSIDKKGNGGTKISTLSPFTVLHTSVYMPFVQDFIKKAADRRLKRVASVAPFEACFESSTIGNSVTGLAVPTVDLVLPGGVQWTIYGANSMVMTNKNVACLAFVDGGTKPRIMSSAIASIVIGGHQLEDNLLVFDLASSKLSFSSSLLLRKATCSHS